MHLTFRQGIARYQTDVYATPTFLRKSSTGDFIDLIVSPDPTIIVFAHRGGTYVVEESRTVLNAWGPFTSGTEYLYWDINLLDASLTRGFTIHPQIVNATAPSNPQNDQHWFDTTEKVMRVWNGTKWAEKIRVFATTYSSSAIIQPFPLGTQAGQTGTFEAGNLVLDAYNKPLRQSDGTFVTSTTELSIINAATKKVKFEAEVFLGLANEFIPKFSFVEVMAGKLIRLARSTNIYTRISGLVAEDLYEGEVGSITSTGIVRNEQWNWPDSAVNRPVFAGTTGQITTIPPVTGVLQVAGYVVDKDAIRLETRAPIVLDDITVTVVNPPGPPAVIPIADFTASQLTGQAPLNVTFTSTSLNSPSSLEWDFNNDGVVDAVSSGVTTISKTFTTPGTYSVRLRAINGYGFDDEIKIGLLTVVAAAKPGATTNLSIQLGGPLQVSKNQIFTISAQVTNDGYAAATNVQRVISIADVGNEALVVSGLPMGSTQSHSSGKTIVVLPVMSVFGTGQFNNVTFSAKAPSNAGKISILGSVNSPEKDSTVSDNTASLEVRVKS